MTLKRRPVRLEETKSGASAGPIAVFMVAAALAGWFLGVDRLSAFKGLEHVRMTNEAFKLVLERSVRGDQELRHYLVDELLDYQPQARASLGEVTSSIDYVRSATRFLERIGEFECAGAAAGTETVPHLRGKLLNLFNTAHNNDAHFGNEALAAFQIWHASALATAAAAKGCYRSSQKQREVLRGALILEAAALHYLQDVLASGHVVTPRRRMHDIPTRLLHDRYNKRGMCFRVEPDFVRDDVEVLTPEGDPSRPEDRAAGWISALDWSGPESRQMVTEAFDWLARVPDGARGMGGGQQSRSGKDACFPNVRFHGDGYLKKACDRDKGSVERCVQRLVITLASARAFADVFQSFESQEVRNSLEAFSWAPMKRFDGTLTLSSAGFFFGEWLPETRTPWPPLPPQLFYYGLGLGLTASQAASRGGDDNSVRDIYGTELLVGLLAPGRRDRSEGIFVDKKVQWALVPGWAWVDAPHHDLNGPTLRFVYSIKSIDTQLSVETAYRDGFPSDFDDDYLYYGLRAEFGFGLLTLFVAAGEDALIRQNGELDRASTARAGLTIALPFSLFTPK